MTSGYTFLSLWAPAQRHVHCLTNSGSGRRSTWQAHIGSLHCCAALQVLSITLDDVRQFLAAWERPDSAVLGVVGEAPQPLPLVTFSHAGFCAHTPAAACASHAGFYLNNPTAACAMCLRRRSACVPRQPSVLPGGSTCARPPAGDFDNREMKEWVREYFGSWQPAPGQPAKPLPLPNPPLPDQGPVAGKLFLVDVPGATQAGVTQAFNRPLQLRCEMLQQSSMGGSEMHA